MLLLGLLLLLRFRPRIQLPVRAVLNAQNLRGRLGLGLLRRVRPIAIEEELLGSGGVRLVGADTGQIKSVGSCGIDGAGSILQRSAASSSGLLQHGLTFLLFLS